MADVPGDAPASTSRPGPSPASRGLIPGLVLGVLTAFAVLALNTGWLLPSVDADGLAYLQVAPALAAGEAPVLPAPTWDDPTATTGLEGRGTAAPLLMSVAVGGGARPHVAALWFLALAAGLLALTAAWVGGGVAGVPGAVVAAAAVCASPLTVETVTSIRPDILVAAAVGFQLGLMVYRPRWNVAHGAAAALAWLAHPVGVGAVAAAAVWPLRGGAGAGRGWGRGAAGAVLAVLPAAVLMASGSVLHGLLVPASLLASGTPSFEGVATGALGILRSFGGGIPGVVGVALGVLVVPAAALAVVRERRGRAPVPEDVHWSDPRAVDLLAGRLVPAAGILSLALTLTALWTGDGGGGLARPWMAALTPVAVLVSASVARVWQGRSGSPGRLPGVVLALWLLTSATAGAFTFRSIRTEGRGYTRAIWVSSEVTRWLDNRSAPYPVIYASDPGLLQLVSGRVARRLPPPDGQDDALRAAFLAAPGAVVLTDDAVAWGEGLADLLGLEVVVGVEEGAVLAGSGDGGGGR